MEPVFRFHLDDLPAESRIRGVRSSRNSLVFVCAGRYEEGVERPAGNLHYHPAGDEQRADTGTKGPRLIGMCFSEEGETKSLRRWLSDRREPLGRSATPTFLRIWRELSSGDPCPIVMESLGHEVLGWLDPDATAERQIPRWLREAHDRVTGDPTGGHTLSSIARSVSIDRTHLAREYRRHFGFSVGEHLRRLRIDTAWQMLVKGCSIENAAVQAGFYDAAHLKRHLTAMTGWSVSEFRTQIRN